MCDEQLCVRIVKTGKWFPLLHPTRVFLCVLSFFTSEGFTTIMVANEPLEKAKAYFFFKASPLTRDSMALHPL